MDEHLQLRAEIGAAADFIIGHFARQHHAAEALLYQKFHALRIVYRHLRAGVQRQIAVHLPKRARHADILHDHAVRARAADFINRFFQSRVFILAHHGI